MMSVLKRLLLIVILLAMAGGLVYGWWIWRQRYRQTPFGQDTFAGYETKAQKGAQKAPPAPGLAPASPPTGISQPGTTASRATSASEKANPVEAKWKTLTSPKTGAARLYSWSPAAVEAGLEPPVELLDQEWRDAVLTTWGGAVIQEDGTAASWQKGNPAIIHRVSIADAAASLEVCGDEVFLRSRRSALYRLSPEGSAPVELARKIVAIYPSARSGFFMATDGGNHTMLFTLRPELTVTAQDTQWRTWSNAAAVTADGKVWALSDNGRLWLKEAEGESRFRHETDQQFADIKPMNQSLLGLTAGTHELVVFNGPPPPAMPANVSRIFGCDGAALAVATDDSAVLWGEKVTGAPLSFRLPEGTKQIRLGPSGLVVAW